MSVADESLPPSVVTPTRGARVDQPGWYPGGDYRDDGVNNSGTGDTTANCETTLNIS